MIIEVKIINFFLLLQVGWQTEEDKAKFKAYKEACIAQSGVNRGNV